MPPSLSRYPHVLILAGLLAACSEPAPIQTADTATVTTAAEASTPSLPAVDPEQRYQNYIRAHNHITAMSSRYHRSHEDMLAAYRQQNLGQAAISTTEQPRLFLEPERLELFIADLSQAQQHTAHDPRRQNLHDSAEAALEAARPLHSLGSELERYIQNKAYLQDDFAVLKVRNDEFIRYWTEFNLAYNRFSQAVAELEADYRQNQIEQLQAEGSHGRRIREQSLLAADTFLNTLADPQYWLHEDTLKRAENELNTLQHILAELEQAATADSDTAALRHTHGHLHQLTRQWPQFKIQPDIAAYNRMVTSYNLAIRY